MFCAQHTDYGIQPGPVKIVNLAFHTSHFILYIAYYLMHAAHCELQYEHYLIRTAHRMKKKWVETTIL